MPSIEPEAYFDAGILRREIDRLFKRRVYVGHVSEFADTGNYKSVQIGDEPITVRRTTSGIRAFGNVCLHRNTLIDPPGTGNKAFRCPYHAWHYDDDGRLTHAPGVDMACLERHALKEHTVIVEHGLVFLRLNTALPDHADVPLVMDKLRLAFDEPFHTEVLEHACNWKLLVENVVEGYHINTVHASSFVPNGISTRSQAEWSGPEAMQDWVIVSGEYPSREMQRLAKLIPGTRLHYGHAYIFPNLFVSNGNDHIAYAGYYLPEDAQRTRLVWSLFELPLLRAQNAEIRQYMRQGAIAFTRKVLGEDKTVIETCQIGLRAPSAGCQIVDPIEPRITRFHRSYMEAMQHG